MIGAQARQFTCQHIAQKINDLPGSLRHSQSSRINFFQRVLVIRAMHHDQGFPQRCCIARIKRGIPLFVFVTEAHNDDIRVFQPFARPNGIYHSALVIMPVLVRLTPEDRDATIV